MKEDKEIRMKVGVMACNAFQQLRFEKKLCDALITLDGAEFHAHKLILCGCSTYFRTLFTKVGSAPDQNMYRIPGVSAHIMELIIEYAYGQHITISEGNVRELLSTANDLKVSELVNECCEVLKAQLGPETCVGIWRLAQLYSLEKLKQQAFQMFLYNFEDILHVSDEFLDLTVEQLSEVIGNDHLNVRHENVVIDAILKWTEHALQERKAKLGVLVPKVRMGLLTPDYFTKVMNITLVIKDEASWPSINSTLFNMCRRLHVTRPRLPKDILLVMGGWSRKPTNGIEAYNSRADSWVCVTCNDKSPRYYHGTVFLNGFVYCIGGCDSVSSSLNSVSRLDPITRTWTEVSPMHYRRCSAGMCVLDGQIYATGGFNSKKALNTVERYNPEINQWNMIAPMNHRRTDSSAAALNGKVYVCGGSQEWEDLSTAEYYSPRMGQWTLIPNMSIKRTGLGVTAYGGELYAVGGQEGRSVYLRSAEVYNPLSNSWRNIPDMIIQRSDFGIAVMDDRLFVVGGFTESRTTRKVEYYDRKTAKWCLIKKMRVSCSGPSCCVVSGLPNMADYIAPLDNP